jgi:hypothetical protein
MHPSLFHALTGLTLFAQPVHHDPHAPATVVPAPAAVDDHAGPQSHVPPAPLPEDTTYGQQPSGTATVIEVQPQSIDAPTSADWTYQPNGADYAQAPVPGYWQPGGYEGRFGSPYYYSVPSGYGQYGAPSYAESPPQPIYDNYGAVNAPYWNPGTAGDVYSTHFGPGYYRHSEYGHYRFPYYSYRAPWYHPGPPTWNRDTNRAW